MTMERFCERFDKYGLEYSRVPAVRFSLKEKRRRKHTGQRSVLMVSTTGMSDEKRRLLSADLEELRKSYISFPIKERSKHLMVRFHNQIYNYGYWPVPWVPRFRVWPSTVPSRATIETMLPIKDDQSQLIASYISNIRRSRRRVIGGFQNEGTQWTKTTVHDNRPLKGGHNCTSWIATAPVDEEKQSLMESIGGDRDFKIGTNPGWWSAWLLSQAKAEVFAIYWDSKPLSEMQDRIDSDGYFVWDFKRM